MLFSSSRKDVREVAWDRQLLEKGHAILVSVLHWQSVDLWKRVKKKVATLWPHKRSLYRHFGGSKAQSSLSALELRFSRRSRKRPRWSFLENGNTKTMTAIFWCGCWFDIRDFVQKPPKLPSGLLAGLLEAGVGFYCKEIKPSTEVRELKKFPRLWGLGSLLELTGDMGLQLDSKVSHEVEQVLWR